MSFSSYCVGLLCVESIVASKYISEEYPMKGFHTYLQMSEHNNHHLQQNLYSHLRWFFLLQP